MYDRFRIWVDTEVMNDRDKSSFRMSPAPPESTELQPASPGQPSSTQQGQQENGFDAGLEGVYIISVAARILDMHPQTLRKYERLGLINPGRTVGMLRLYSREDIRKVFLIRHLMETLGLNLAGVEFALNLVENLQGFKQYLQSVAEGTDVEPKIEPAMAQLFRNLNLPGEES